MLQFSHFHSGKNKTKKKPKKKMTTEFLICRLHAVTVDETVE